MSKTNHKRQTFTVAAAIKYLADKGLDVKLPTFYRWINNGNIPHSRPTPTCQNIKIERQDLDNLLKKR